ncbi:MAG: hypothetical protein HQL95_06405 [Magnetococcales bacterium]|nr:hypothetical protein [Magnetococcales bacterium]
MSLLKQIARFLLTYRKMWMGPVILTILLLGGLLVLAQGSALSPFLYAIF